MSSNLFYSPLVKTGKCLSKDLKYILSPRYFQHDGSLTSEHVILDSKDVAFLEGVEAGSSNIEVRKPIQELLKAIDKYGEVEIWTE